MSKKVDYELQTEDDGTYTLKLLYVADTFLLKKALMLSLRKIGYNSSISLDSFSEKVPIELSYYSKIESSLKKQVRMLEEYEKEENLVIKDFKITDAYFIQENKKWIMILSVQGNYYIKEILQSSGTETRQ
jgi:hypothetical protein